MWMFPKLVLLNSCILFFSRDHSDFQGFRIKINKDLFAKNRPGEFSFRLTRPEKNINFCCFLRFFPSYIPRIYIQPVAKYSTSQIFKMYLAVRQFICSPFFQKYMKLIHDIGWKIAKKIFWPNLHWAWPGTPWKLLHFDNLIPTFHEEHVVKWNHYSVRKKRSDSIIHICVFD